MKTNVAFTDIILELHVPNFNLVKDFYGKLGFKKMWEYPPKDESGYLVMCREKSILAFYCGNEQVYKHPFFKRFSKKTPRGYGVEVCIYISDQKIEDYYNSLLKILPSSRFAQKLELKPWGRKDFRLTDPFGFYICIREPDNILIK